MSSPRWNAHTRKVLRRVRKPLSCAWRPRPSSERGRNVQVARLAGDGAEARTGRGPSSHNDWCGTTTPSGKPDGRRRRINMASVSKLLAPVGVFRLREIGGEQSLRRSYDLCATFIECIVFLYLTPSRQYEGLRCPYYIRPYQYRRHILLSCLSSCRLRSDGFLPTNNFI